MAVASDQITLVLGPMRAQLDQAREDGAEQVAPADLTEAMAALDEMESLAAACTDLAEWTTKLAAENWWPRFTEPLTRVLAAVGQATFSGGARGDGDVYDDGALLAQTIGAYEAAIASKEGSPDEGCVVPVLKEIMALGRSGVSYPVFLRQLEVRGLTSVLAGLVVPTREQLVADMDRYRSQLDVSRQGRSEALVRARDELMARNPFGAIDPVDWELASTRIEWEWEPQILRDDAVLSRARTIFVLLGDWLDAHSEKAPGDARWAAGSAKETRRNLDRTRRCAPGFFQVRLRQLSAGFRMDLTGLLSDPAFPRARLDFGYYLGDERLDLSRAAEPFCRPGGAPPSDLVARATALMP